MKPTKCRSLLLHELGLNHIHTFRCIQRHVPDIVCCLWRRASRALYHVFLILFCTTTHYINNFKYKIFIAWFQRLVEWLALTRIIRARPLSDWIQYNKLLFHCCCTDRAIVLLTNGDHVNIDINNTLDVIRDGNRPFKNKVVIFVYCLNNGIYCPINRYFTQWYRYSWYNMYIVKTSLNSYLFGSNIVYSRFYSTVSK